ncbi:hypothetical protein [Salinarimonas rosea]|uniref:hypothetical protein n=1 Tax=Salinarimonas rosea TaxID=552063 RepID=UPI0004260D59|nr:hypothetical protein [Salinarimonas rosea]
MRRLAIRATRAAGTAALATALFVSAGAHAQDGLVVEVRPSGPPAWLDPPNTPLPGALEGATSRYVYTQMVLTEPSALVAQRERYGHHLLPRRREMGDLPPFIEFE